MNLSSKSLTLASLFLLALAGCTKNEKQVTPLPAQVQTSVNQNLLNGRVPSPTEVDQNNVPQAVDQCAAFRNSLPKDYLQDFIEVPEDPSQPNGTKIKVFYYGKLNPNSTPIFFYNGGPGADSHSSYSVISRSQNVFDRDKQLSFIYIDQRGNGCSDFYPQGTTPDISARLVNYGSSAIASDSEFIRKKLVNDKQVIAFGQSYGAFIVHRYATLFPKSLKAGFAHANTITSDGYDRVKMRIASQKRINDMYFSQYADDVERVKALKNYLAADKCFTAKDDSTRKRCGISVVSPVLQLIGFVDQWIAIHEWIGIMVDKNGVSDSGIAKFLAVFSFTKNNPLNSKNWAEDIIDYSDRNVPSFDFPTCSKIKTDLAKENIDLDGILLNECATALQFHSKPLDPNLFANIKTQFLTLTDFVSSLKANPQMNFYAYSGQKDPYVSVEEFAEELNATQGISNFHYFNFPSSGHNGFEMEPRLWQELTGEASSGN